MNVITISTYPSMPWRWRVVGPSGRRQQECDAANAGDAAAKAINWALRVGAPYCIVGHDDAIKLIPEAVRQKS